MSDITMCKGGNCPLKEKCKRFTATANPDYQSYFVEVPFKDGSCKMFWGDTQDSILQQLKNICIFV